MTDRFAFDEFVHARSGALARTAYLLTGNHHTAEDLVQHALLQTARHWERISTSPEAYARRVMYHLLVAQAPLHRDEPRCVRRSAPAA